MSDFLSELSLLPADSQILFWLTMSYILITAITTYDSRLIQFKMGTNSSGVALRSQGKSLPAWVGIFAWMSWINLALIVWFGGIWAFTLYVILFVLRTIPVMEYLGFVLMRPFLVQSSGIP